MMKQIFVAILGTLACVVVLACPAPPPPTAQTVLDADGAILSPTPATACANLAKLGCGVAADGGSCVTALSNVVNAGLSPVDLGCMTAATTKAAATRCFGIGLGGCP
jgi:hypothetical protein